jgi:hypothetical protein
MVLGDAGEEREEAGPFALLRMTIHKGKGFIRAKAERIGKAEEALWTV